MILSHDLDLLVEMCDSLLVIANGEIVERGEIQSVTIQPRREETRHIVEAASAMRNAALRFAEPQG